MSDFLLDLGQNSFARKLIKTTGLPIPMPQVLERSGAPRTEKELAGHDVAFGAGTGGALSEAVARTLGAAGAQAYVVGTNETAKPFESAGGPAPKVVVPGEPPEGLRVRSLVFDATGLTWPKDLREVYDFLNPWVPLVEPCGRVVLLARPPEEAAGAAERAATQRGLEGIARSLGKELGRKGVTAQVVYVSSGAEARLDAVLRFLLSPRSAFVSGQPFHVDGTSSGEPGTKWSKPLAGKTVLLTGAARGIGAATAKLLADEGAKVVCLDRPADEEPLAALAKEIGGATLLADVTDADAPTKIAETLKKDHGGVDVVIHNAGITRDKTIARMKGELWDQAVDVNLGAVVRITAQLLNDGVIKDGGRVVCLSSVAGIAGNVGQTNYAASKAGLIGYIEELARQDGIRAKGITVNAVAPGFIETRLTAAIPMAIREAGRRLASLGQGGQPEDVGQMLTFLATPGSQGINGRVMRVCGGAFIGA